MQRRLFSEDHETFRKTLRAFIEREMFPHYDAWCHLGHVPRELYRKLGELGFWGIEVPEQYGGAGIDSFKYTAVLTEETTSAGVSIGGGAVHVELCCRTWRRMPPTNR